MGNDFLNREPVLIGDFLQQLIALIKTRDVFPVGCRRARDHLLVVLWHEARFRFV